MWLLNTLVILSLVFGVIYGNDEIETKNDGDDGDADITIEDGVLVLTADNFESVTKDNEFVLVEFYAPWCTHCEALAPEYAKVAKEFKEKGSKIKLAKVDATEELQLAKEFSIRGYPVLKFFRRGTPIDYTGNRQAEDIANWLNKKSGPVAVDVETVDAAEEFIKSESVVIIGFFKDRESPEAKTFLSVANDVDYPFGITNNDDVYAKYEAKCGSIILFKNYDEGKSVFNGESTEEAIKEFITVESIPLIVDFDRETQKFLGSLNIHLLMFVSKETFHMEKYVEPAKDVAKQFRNKVLFVSINVDDESYERILTFFDVRKEEVPSLRLVRSEDASAQYRPSDVELSPENIKTFVQDFLDDKLKKHLRSQDLPKDWDDKPVKTLVSANFDEVAFNKDKDVFVEFYAPWSDDSKEFELIFGELGEKYKDSETIVIAKIDATANELEHTPFPSSFPTLKLYKKGDNAVVDYIGKRTLESFIKFLESGGIEQEVEEEEEKKEEEEVEAEGIVESEESVGEKEPIRDEF